MLLSVKKTIIVKPTKLQLRLSATFMVRKDTRELKGTLCDSKYVPNKAIEVFDR